MKGHVIWPRSHKEQPDGRAELLPTPFFSSLEANSLSEQFLFLKACI